MKNVYKIRFVIAILVLVFAISQVLRMLLPVNIFSLQLIPLIQKMLFDYSWISLLLLSGILLLTFLFGRFYCSTICPLGILQEIASSLNIKKNNRYIPVYPFKYFICAVSFGLLFAGSSFIIKHLDPYTYFSSALTLSAFGILAVVSVLTIVFFKDRFFCTNICPVGTFLGLISKLSLNKIYIDKEKCISCTMCEKQCPSACINIKNKNVDNENCIKCLRCIEVCKNECIKFGQIKTDVSNFDPERRKFLLTASAFVIAYGIGRSVIPEITKNIMHKFKAVILPPGAGQAEEFVNKCLNCNLCVNNCPGKIIVKADNEFPAVHIDYSKGYCDKNCNKCSQVCPTGAIKHLTLAEKQQTKIASAVIDYEKCTRCGHCIGSCPYGAISKSNDRVIINSSKCVGCGACKRSCFFGAMNTVSVLSFF